MLIAIPIFVFLLITATVIAYSSGHTSGLREGAKLGRAQQGLTLPPMPPLPPLPPLPLPPLNPGDPAFDKLFEDLIQGREIKYESSSIESSSEGKNVQACPGCGTDARIPENDYLCKDCRGRN